MGFTVSDIVHEVDSQRKLSASFKYKESDEDVKFYDVQEEDSMILIMWFVSNGEERGLSFTCVLTRASTEIQVHIHTHALKFSHVHRFTHTHSHTLTLTFTTLA